MVRFVLMAYSIARAGLSPCTMRLQRPLIERVSTCPAYGMACVD